MKISELAQAAHTQSETIRYYERQGLLPEPTRTGANYRSYDSGHLERLSFIRHCRSLDMTLSEVRTLLRLKDAPEENCAEVNALLEAHVGHVAQRIKELKALEKELRALRLQCASSRKSADCGILEGLEQAARQAPPVPGRSKPGHIHGAHGGVGV